MIRNFIKTGIFAIVAILAAGCNDAKYNPDSLEAGAYLVESMKSAGIAGETITIKLEDESSSILLTPAVTKLAEEDLTYKLVVDEQLLKTYGKEQGTEFDMLPDDLFDLGKEVTIPAGSYSGDPITVTIKQLPALLKGSPIALPVKLEKVKGSVDVTSTTSGFVCVVAAEAKDYIAYFKGASGLKTDAFADALKFPNFTIEVRFQMSDFGVEGAGGHGRNRDVFQNGNKILCRFEDPQTTNDKDPRHSQVQFQADGFQNPAVGNHFELNQWQHFAVTYDGTDITLYYNGKDVGVGAGAKSHIPESMGNCEFLSYSFMGGASGGSHGINGSAHWGDCKILCTEARVWSVCRTADQIANNIKSVSPNSQGLEGYWKMTQSTATTDGSVTSFMDLTGKGHDLKTTANIAHWPIVSSEDTATEWPE